MKKLSLLLSLLIIMSFNIMALDVVVCNFDDVSPASAISTELGGQFAPIANPKIDANNPSAMCGSFYNDQTNWQGKVVIPITPFTIPASGICFVAIKVKHSTMPDAAITIASENGGGGLAIRSSPTYSNANAGEWQELIFDLGNNRPAGTVVDTINLLGDMKWNSGGAYVTSISNPMFFDEIRAYDISVPEHTDKDLCDFESAQTATPAFGFNAEIAANPFKDANTNNTDNSLKIGRDNATNYYALVDVNVDNFMVPQSDVSYVHVMVNSPKALKVSLRTEMTGNNEHYAMNPYSATDVNTWKDLVFDLGAVKDPGFSMNYIRLLMDYSKVLAPGTEFAYIDEIIVNEDNKPRTIAAGPATLNMTLSTFETLPLDWTAQFGASIERVINTDNSGLSINMTDTCAKLGDDKSTYYALMNHSTTFTLPDANCYLHIMAKSTISPKLSIRTMPDNTNDIFPVDTLLPNNEWQDLVFNLKANKYSGYVTDSLRLMLDYFGDQLNNTDAFLYIDELIIDTSATPRTNTPTKLNTQQSSTLSVYPNPAQDKLFITGENVARISIYNTAGQMVMQSANLDGGLNISSLQQGIFFINCKDASGRMVANKTFIKK